MAHYKTPMHAMPATLLRLAAVAVSMSWVASGTEPEPPSSSTRVVVVSSGWRLVGDWVLPSGDGAVPAALLLHRAAGSRAEYSVLAEALAQRGIASLSLDLRGHGESDNLGTFEPPYAENRNVIERTHDDVRAALRWIAGQARVDPARIGAVGASYSGEAIGEALREGGENVAAVVLLSPGSFSRESMALIDADATPWLFIRTSEESHDSLEFIDAVFEALATESESAQIRVLPGAGHATRMFESRPLIIDELADWLAQHLGA